MFERICYALLYLCGIALCFYLIVWVIGQLGIMIPSMVLHILVCDVRDRRRPCSLPAVCSGVRRLPHLAGQSAASGSVKRSV